jgi:acetate---CoA ligase (ADP-forming)
MRVESTSELAGTLAMFDQPRRAGKGGVVGISDSGGECELFIDLAHDAKVPLAKMTAKTTEMLASWLDPGLEPVNPLDAWCAQANWEEILTECFCAMVGDTNTAIGTVFTNLRDKAASADAWVRVAIEASKRFDKPVAIVNNFGWMRHDEQIKALTAAQIPVIEDIKCSLAALRKVLDYRDRAELPKIAPPKPVSAKIKARWRVRLARPEMLDEAEGLTLLKDYGIPVLDVRVVEDEASTLKAVRAVGFPVALKTAKLGIVHKSDVDGVKLNLADAKAVRAAYADLKKRLGPRVLVAPKAPAGVEMSLGMISDDQFGPLVVIGAGGIFIELLGDRTVALPNFDVPTAGRYIDKLETRALLDGKRGKPPSYVASFAKAASRLSLLAHDLGDLLAELDVNPVIVGPKHAVAVDALVVPRAAVGVKKAKAHL